jgi:hypothetical protein
MFVSKRREGTMTSADKIIKGIMAKAEEDAKRESDPKDLLKINRNSIEDIKAGVISLAISYKGKEQIVEEAKKEVLDNSIAMAKQFILRKHTLPEIRHGYVNFKKNSNKEITWQDYLDEIYSKIKDKFDVLPYGNYDKRYF